MSSQMHHRRQEAEEVRARRERVERAKKLLQAWADGSSNKRHLTSSNPDGRRSAGQPPPQQPPLRPGTCAHTAVPPMDRTHTPPTSTPPPPTRLQKDGEHVARRQPPVLRLQRGDQVGQRAVLPPALPW